MRTRKGESVTLVREEEEEEEEEEDEEENEYLSL